MEYSLLRYYEQELAFIRRMGEEFARKYPKVAARLLLEPGKCEDPSTERVIEAFAFLAGRIHKKIEDDFPEITESLLNIIFPHYVRPIPSMSIVEFQASKKAVPPEGYNLEKGTALFSRPVGGIPCQFSTCYPVTLWPFDIVTAELRDPKHPVKNSIQALVIRIGVREGLRFSQVQADELRIFLNGSAQQTFPLYELLGNNVVEVVGEFGNERGRTETVTLARDCIEPCGFEADQAMMPYPQSSFPGYGLLLEYFSFPEKFLFFTIKGISRLMKRQSRDTIDLWIYLDKPLKAGIQVSARNFLLSATPVVNLYKRIAEPIWIDQTKTEYQVVPDVRRPLGAEIFSIDRVMVSSDVTGREIEVVPFYSVRHHLENEQGKQKAFWRLGRRPSERQGDDGSDVYLSFTDWALNPADPGAETATVHTTCTNRDLPGRLPFGNTEGDFEMEVSAPVERIVSLVKPTPTRRPAMGAALQWRLISHLSLNYLSILEGGEEALKELLKLYDFDDSPVTRQQIHGIVGLTSGFATKRIGQSFCRGLQVTIEFDEEKYVGSGLYLFASVLEQFLGQYVSINSFSQLIAKTLQKKEPLRLWPPRNGNRILL